MDALARIAARGSFSTTLARPGRRGLPGAQEVARAVDQQWSRQGGGKGWHQLLAALDVTVNDKVATTVTRNSMGSGYDRPGNGTA